MSPHSTSISTSGCQIRNLRQSSFFSTLLCIIRPLCSRSTTVVVQRWAEVIRQTLKLKVCCSYFVKQMYYVVLANEGYIQWLVHLMLIKNLLFNKTSSITSFWLWCYFCLNTFAHPCSRSTTTETDRIEVQHTANSEARLARIHYYTHHHSATKLKVPCIKLFLCREGRYFFSLPMLCKFPLFLHLLSVLEWVRERNRGKRECGSRPTNSTTSKYYCSSRARSFLRGKDTAECSHGTIEKI